MKKFINVILVSMINLSNLAYASVPIDGLIANCKLTPEIKNLKHAPAKFNLSNNLRKHTGSFQSAIGKEIMIYGRVMDKNCVPVTEAVIEVWQANANGFYQNNFMEKYLDKKNSYDPNFVGSATARTDNLGRFSFISILPGKNSNITSHLNIQLTHPQINNFSTKLYFDTNAEDINDSMIKNLDISQRNRLIAAPYQNQDLNDNNQNLSNHDQIYFFDIVLNFESKHKTY